MSDAQIRISAVDQTKAAIDSAKRNLQSLGDQANALPVAFGALGVSFAAAFAVNQLKSVIDSADSLNKLSQKTGLATEDLSQLQYAAKLADISNESLETTIRKLNVSIADGLAGDKEKIALFKSLGISTADLGKGTKEVFLQIADAYAKGQAGAGKVAVGNGLMGESADVMIPLLNGGRKAITDLMKEADKLGLTIGTDFAKNAEEFNDNLTRTEMSGKRLAIVLGADLVKGLGEAMKAMADASIEGGKLAGIVAGIQTLLTGNDRHKNNVELVDLTDELMTAENALSRARAKDAQYGDRSLDTAATEKRVADIRGRLATTMSYRKLLEAEDEKIAAAAGKAKAAQETAPEIKAPPKGVSDKSANAKEQKKLMLELAGFTRSFSDDWATLNAAYADPKSKMSLEQLIEAQGKLLSMQPAIKAAADAQKARMEDIERGEQKNKQISDRYIEGLQAEGDQLVKSNKSLQEQAEEIGLVGEALNVVRLARLDANIALQEELVLSARGMQGNEAQLEQLERKLGLMRQERQISSDASTREIKSAEDADNKRRTETISASISEGLLDGFRNGRSISDIFLSELKAQFAKTVLQPLISPIVAAGNSALNDILKGAGGSGLLSSLGSLFGGGGEVASAAALDTLGVGLSFDGGEVASAAALDTLGVGLSFDGGEVASAAALDTLGVGLSFDGGGSTGNGPRIGGLDGKGGFMAMLHPQETVTDHTKGQQVGGGNTVINYHFENGTNRADLFAAVQQSRALARQDRMEDGRRRR